MPTADEVVVTLIARTRQYTERMNAAAAAAQKLQTETQQTRAAAAKPIPAPRARSFAPVSKSLGKVNDQVTNVQANVGNLSAQFNDIGVTAAAGMSPMLIALQQGTQLSQAFAGQTARQSIRGLGAAFASVISPVSLLTIGVVAGGAALLQWGISALTAEDGASKLEKTLEALESAMSDLVSADDALSSGDLAEKYGRQADEAARLLKVQRQIATIRAQLAASESIRNIGESLGGTPGVLAERIRLIGELATAREKLNDVDPTKSIVEFNKVASRISEINAALEGTESASEAVERVAEMFSITEIEARKVVTAMGDMQKATGLKDQTEAAQRLIDYLRSVTNGFKDVTQEGNEIAFQLADILLKAGQLSEIDLASNMSSAADAAGRLADNLAAGIENARNLMEGLRSDLADLNLENAFFGQPVELAVAQARAAFEEARPANPNASPQAAQARLVQLDKVLAKAREVAEAEQALAEKRRKAAEAARGGGGGGRAGPSAEEMAALREQEALYQSIASQAEEHIRRQHQQAEEARQILESLMTPAERFAQKMEEIRTDPVLTETQKADAIERLKAIQPAAMQLSNTLSSAFKGLFDNLDEGLKGISDSLKDLGVQLLKMALFKQLASFFPGAFGSGGAVPLVGNATGGVYSGSGISAYSGSVVSKPTIFPFARGAGLMGEAGPEAILPLTQVNGKLGVQASGRGDSGAVFQVVDKRGAGAPPIDVQRSRGPNGQEMVRAIVSEDMSRGRYDKPMQGRYGQKPQKVMR